MPAGGDPQFEGFTRASEGRINYKSVAAKILREERPAGDAGRGSGRRMSGAERMCTDVL